MSTIINLHISTVTLLKEIADEKRDKTDNEVLKSFYNGQADAYARLLKLFERR